jgi:hypothetical protein
MSSGSSPQKKASHSNEKQGRPQKSRSPSRGRSVDLGEDGGGADGALGGAGGPPAKRGRSPSKKGPRGKRGSSDPKSPDSSPTRASRSRSRSRSRSGSPDKRGRSKSPGKFGNKDFEHKKLSADAVKKRQNAIAKVRGLKQEPKEWSRTELLQRLQAFAKFTLDDKTGSGTVTVRDKRMLGEDVQVLLEVMRRITEIQSLTLAGCSLTDEALAQVSVGLGGLRHLRHLDLRSNLLTKASVDLVCRMFSKLTRKLSVLDMQFNPLTVQDGRALFNAFSPSPQAAIKELNGLPMAELMSDDLIEVLSLPDKNLRLAELGIVISLIPKIPRLHTLDLSRNSIDSEGLNALTKVLRKANKVSSLDLSDNPLTSEGLDFSGLEDLVKYAKENTLLTHVKLEGVIFPSPQKQEQLQLSLMANRAVYRQKRGGSTGRYFNEFARDLIRSKAKPQTGLLDMEHWQGKLTQLDLAFIRLNQVKQPRVELVLAGGKAAGRDEASGRDEILIHEPAVSSKNIIEF